ncbi:MAG: DUF983 domain-containing protein [Cyclobacteriaceae bacterium]
MHKNCTVCNQNFEPEPGFYYGAMIISYVVCVAVSIASGMILFYVFDDPDMWIYLLTVVVLMMLLAPISYRYSRSVMLHFFGGVKFDAKYEQD